MTKMTSTKYFIAQLINCYKECTCLWQTTDPDYRNINKRNAAYAKILRFYQKTDPNATREDVKNKIHAMRCSFRKELRKVKLSEQSGVETNELYVPRLWYFNLLDFIVDKEKPLLFSSTVYQQNMPFGYDESNNESTDYEMLHSIDKLPQESSREPSPCLSSKTFKRSIPKANPVLLSNPKRVAQSTVVPPTRKAKFDAFGEHIAEKLRDMSDDMVPICQKIINDAIFLGETNNLNLRARIALDSASSIDPLQ